jgi:alpha-tubulin suppressor-like RCC1 family protein
MSRAAGPGMGGQGLVGQGTVGHGLVGQGIRRWGDARSGIRLLLGLSFLLAGCDPAAITGAGEPAAPQTFLAVATGGNHTCAVRIDGSVWCWGDGAEGQLGTGENLRAFLPVRALSDEAYVGVTAGQRHTCALTDRGDIRCWGWNSQSQLGDGTTFTNNRPAGIASVVRFTQVVAGSLHTCALALDGRAWCWGASGQGQGGATPQSGVLSIPTVVPGPDRFVALSAGGFHTCGIRADRRVMCWGMNHVGQLGDGTSRNRDAPVLVASAVPFESIDAGYTHTCAVTPEGAVNCWGEGVRGALGDRTAGPVGSGTLQPSALFSPLSFSRVSAGLHYGCAVSRAQELHCWGAGTEGQSGDPRLLDWATPQGVLTSSPVRFRAVSASAGTHTCALSTGFVIYCWGEGPRGQLGLGSVTFTPTPSRVQIQ